GAGTGVGAGDRKGEVHADLTAQRQEVGIELRVAVVVGVRDVDRAHSIEAAGRIEGAVDADGDLDAANAVDRTVRVARRIAVDAAHAARRTDRVVGGCIE